MAIKLSEGQPMQTSAGVNNSKVTGTVNSQQLANSKPPKAHICQQEKTQKRTGSKLKFLDQLNDKKNKRQSKSRLASCTTVHVPNKGMIAFTLFF
jgi:hypothetical protein